MCLCINHFNHEENKIITSFFIYPVVDCIVFCVFAYMVYTNELVLFQLSRLLGCFSNIMG